MGGTDDPSNIVLLTVEQHADAHRVLFEEHGKQEDYIAWKALSGQLGKEELLHERAKLGAYVANSNGAHLKGNQELVRKWKTDKKFAERVREKLSKPKQNKENYFGPKSETHCENIRKAALKRERIPCPKCGNGYTKANYKKHYESCSR